MPSWKDPGQARWALNSGLGLGFNVDGGLVGRLALCHLRCRLVIGSCATFLHAILETLDCAAEVGAEPGQVALAWVLSRGQDVVPIPGTKKVSRLEENAAAASVAAPARPAGA